MSNIVDNVCVVCFKTVHIFSVGCCDHIVCFECSTRMRVLCRQNECPICRQEMGLVVFTDNVKPFSELQSKTTLLDKKYNIAFTSRKVQETFYRLLEHNCSLCHNKNFKTFHLLNQHVKREHERFFCDLCVDNLKILTSERRHYSRSELAQHRRKGDPDDKSHRGHPLCEFCDTRYIDNDDLYRHLRRDHLYCHFCDADGLHLYYSSYDYLRDHFQQEHFLCEEGSCYEEKFTPVFRTEIDFRAHRAAEHSRALGKAAVKQARTLDLEFQLKPRMRSGDVKGRRGRNADLSFASEAVEQVEPVPSQAPANLDLNNFPSLGNSSGASSVPLTNLGPPQMRGLTVRNVERKGAQYDQHFPGLPSGGPAATAIPPVRPNITQEKKPAHKSSNTSVINSSKANRSSRLVQDDFPALANPTSAPSASSSGNWNTVASKKTPSNQPKKQVETKPRPPPKPKDEDFPSLTTKFTTNLNFKSSDPIESNFVNIKNKLSKDTKSAWSDKSRVEELKTLVEVEPEVKAKKKKKKNGEEATNKKDDKKNLSPKKEQKSPSKNNEKKGENPVESKKENAVKPLPTAEEWFGTSKGKSVEEPKGKAVHISGKKSSSPKKEQKSQMENIDKRKSTGIPAKEGDVLTKPLPTAAEWFDITREKLEESLLVNERKPANDVSGIISSNCPPPGFVPMNGIKAPPGFAEPVTNGLAPNSSIEALSVRASHQYLPPVDFDSRNIHLVTKVNEILLNKESLEEFRLKSAQFRSGEIDAEQYYQHCIKTLGESGSTVVLPELLVLLPDIPKQLELFRVLLKYGGNNSGKQKLESCSTCQQVVSLLEMKHHLASHVLHINSWGFT